MEGVEEERRRRKMREREGKGGGVVTAEDCKLSVIVSVHWKANCMHLFCFIGIQELVEGISC